MSGVPYVHSDAGGFGGGEGDNELYVRWLEFAAFTPIFRPHGTALYEKDPGAFSFPSEPALIDEPFRTYAKEVVKTRYAFLPYNYSLAYQQTKDGRPLMTPLYYYFPNDTTAVSIADEYMWGENILVAPVLEKGAKTRTYYLPEGTWYKQDNPGRFVSGNTWQTDSAELSRIPVFFREGAFVLLNTQGAANTTNYHGDSLLIAYVSSGHSSSFDFYNDDGSTKNAIEKKEYELISFSSTGVNNKSLVLSVRSNRGNYTGKRKNKSMLFDIIQQKGKPSLVVVNGQKFSEISDTLNLKKNHFVYKDDGAIYFYIDFKDQPVNIRVIW